MMIERDEILDVEEQSYAGLPAVNVGFWERLASIGVGTVLLFKALGKMSISGSLLFLGGAYLLFRGIVGHCPVYEQLGVDTSKLVAWRREAQEPSAEVASDEVLESSWESFPTSDAPAWTMGKREEEA
jgi:hypothetical protein